MIPIALLIKSVALLALCHPHNSGGHPRLHPRVARPVVVRHIVIRIGKPYRAVRRAPAHDPRYLRRLTPQEMRDWTEMPVLTWRGRFWADARQ